MKPAGVKAVRADAAPAHRHPPAGTEPVHDGIYQN